VKWRHRADRRRSARGRRGCAWLRPEGELKKSGTGLRDHLAHAFDLVSGQMSMTTMSPGLRQPRSTCSTYARKLLAFKGRRAASAACPEAVTNVVVFQCPCESEPGSVGVWGVQPRRRASLVLRPLSLMKVRRSRRVQTAPPARPLGRQRHLPAPVGRHAPSFSNAPAGWPCRPGRHTAGISSERPGPRRQPADPEPPGRCPRGTALNGLHNAHPQIPIIGSRHRRPLETTDQDQYSQHLGRGSGDDSAFAEGDLA
jgi:hypothetical protein